MNGLRWYTKKSQAEHAAAARVLDCLFLRGTQGSGPDAAGRPGTAANRHCSAAGRDSARESVATAGVKVDYVLTILTEIWKNDVSQ